MSGRLSANQRSARCVTQPTVCHLDRLPFMWSCWFRLSSRGAFCDGLKGNINKRSAPIPAVRKRVLDDDWRERPTLEGTNGPTSGPSSVPGGVVL